MSHKEFLELHEASETLMRAYFVEVERSSTLLAECKSDPLPLDERLTLLSQGIVEHDAHLTYMGAKSVLINAALLGYGFPN